MKMTSEKFNLTWNEFEKCAGNSFKKLLRQQEFVDVTLVSEDHKQIKAHKVVLSACSPILKKILIRNYHQHPLIFLTGVKYQELESLVNFMYLGQVEVFQNDLNIFMNFADKFQIQGLCKKGVDENKYVIDPYSDTKLEKEEVENAPMKEYIHSSTYPVMKNEISYDNENEVDSDFYRAETIGSADEIFSSLHDSSSLSKRNNEFTCEQCGYKSKLKHHMQAHIKAKHEGIKFPCNKCDYKASFAHNLTVHAKSKHGASS